MRALIQNSVGAGFAQTLLLISDSNPQQANLENLASPIENEGRMSEKADNL